MRPGRYAPVAVFVALAVAVQAVAVLAGKGFLLTQLTMSAYYTLVVLGLSVLMGYAGQISLGHAGFFAIGGYTSAVLTTWDLAPLQKGWLVPLLAQLHLLDARVDLYGGKLLTVQPWVAFPCAVALA